MHHSTLVPTLLAAASVVAAAPRPQNGGGETVIASASDGPNGASSTTVTVGGGMPAPTGLGGSNSTKPNPFAGGNPFGGSNPFGNGGNPFGNGNGGNPFSGGNNPFANNPFFNDPFGNGNGNNNNNKAKRQAGETVNAYASSGPNGAVSKTVTIGGGAAPTGAAGFGGAGGDPFGSGNDADPFANDPFFNDPFGKRQAGETVNAYASDGPNGAFSTTFTVGGGAVPTQAGNYGYGVPTEAPGYGYGGFSKRQAGETVNAYASDGPNGAFSTTFTVGGGAAPTQAGNFGYGVPTEAAGYGYGYKEKRQYGGGETVFAHASDGPDGAFSTTFTVGGGAVPTQAAGYGGEGYGDSNGYGYKEKRQYGGGETVFAHASDGPDGAFSTTFTVGGGAVPTQAAGYGGQGYGAENGYGYKEKRQAGETVNAYASSGPNGAFSKTVTIGGGAGGAAPTGAAGFGGFGGNADPFANDPFFSDPFEKRQAGETVNAYASSGPNGAVSRTVTIGGGAGGAAPTGAAGFGGFGGNADPFANDPFFSDPFEKRQAGETVNAYASSGPNGAVSRTVTIGGGAAPTGAAGFGGFGGNADPFSDDPFFEDGYKNKRQYSAAPTVYFPGGDIPVMSDVSPSLTVIPYKRTPTTLETIASTITSAPSMVSI